MAKGLSRFCRSLGEELYPAQQVPRHEDPWHLRVCGHLEVLLRPGQISALEGQSAELQVSGTVGGVDLENLLQKLTCLGRIPRPQQRHGLPHQFLNRLPLCAGRIRYPQQ
jgi:hypothetical protein